MKKSTWIAVTIAVALGAFVYFYDSKHNPKAPGEEASWKPAFSVKAADITGLTLENKSNPAKVVFVRQGKTWQITEPVQARADQSSLSEIVDDLGSAKLHRSFQATDTLSAYGLAPPSETIEFQLEGGARHTLEFGDKDFSNSLVYVRVDGSKTVGLLPVSLLDETDKPVLELRDRSVLDLNGAGITALTLKNPGGTVQLEKSDDHWKLVKPRKVAADSDTVDSLVSTLSTAKFTQVASESPKDLARYGLARPAITLDVATKSGRQFRLVAAERGKGDYFARDLSRPMIFRIDASLYTALEKKFFALRDKAVTHFDASNLASVQLQNPHGTMRCVQAKDGSWTMVQPAAEKGKSVQSWKIFDPIQNARAIAIIDRPTPAEVAQLSKPEIQIALTDKSGKKTTIHISHALGKTVLVGTSSGPAIYVLKKQILKELGFTVSKLLT